MLRIVSALLFVFWAGTALAKQKVQIAEIKGSIAFMVEGAIKNALKRQKLVELSSSGNAVLITATTERGPKGWIAEISVRSGDKVVKSWRAQAKEIRKLSQTIEKKLWKQLGSAIMSASPSPAVGGKNPPPAEEPAEDEPEEEDDAPASGGDISIADRAPQQKSAPSGRSRSNDISRIGKDEESAAPPPAEKKNDQVESGSGLIDSGEKKREPGVGSDANLKADTRRAAGHQRNTTPFAASIGLNYFTRSLRYKDDLFGELRPYTLSGAPAPVVDLTIYPGAFLGGGIAAHLGVSLHAEYALALKSEDSAGRDFPTSELELEGALRGRLPFAAHEITLSAGAGTHSFSIDNAGDGADPDVPAVSYTFLRLGLDARFELIEALNITLSGAYRPVLSAGEISEAAWFGRASTGAVDAGLRIAYAVLPSLDIIVGADMRRYFYTLNPEPGDPRIAGGALDQYFSWMLAIGWHLR